MMEKEKEEVRAKEINPNRSRSSNQYRKAYLHHASAAEYPPSRNVLFASTRMIYLLAISLFRSKE